jgi:AraC family transcriptional regulator
MVGLDMDLSILESPFGGRVIRTREFSGLRLVDGVYSAETRVPTHSHQQAVFCIALKGGCSEIYAGKLREYEALTVEFLPSNQCHSLNFPRADTRAFSIDVATSWLERAHEYSLRLENSVYCHGGLLSGLMMKLYGEFLQPDGASHLAIEGLALEMLAEVSRRHVRLSDRTPPRWLAQAVELLRERFSERLTITHVAATVGVHPVHLAREFRRFHRCTIGEYIRQLRVERACRQLAASNEPLAAIASSVGFSDQSHFSRTFKRLIGVTPAAYRASFAH